MTIWEIKKSCVNHQSRMLCRKEIAESGLEGNLNLKRESAKVMIWISWQNVCDLRIKSFEKIFLEFLNIGWRRAKWTKLCKLKLFIIWKKKQKIKHYLYEKSKKSYLPDASGARTNASWLKFLHKCSISSNPQFFLQSEKLFHASENNFSQNKKPNRVPFFSSTQRHSIKALIFGHQSQGAVNRQKGTASSCH